MIFFRSTSSPPSVISGRFLAVISSRLFSPLSRSGRRQAALFGARFPRSSSFSERLSRGVRVLGRRDSFFHRPFVPIHLVKSMIFFASDVSGSIPAVRTLPHFFFFIRIVHSKYTSGSNVFTPFRVIRHNQQCHVMRRYAARSLGHNKCSKVFCGDHFLSPNSASGLVQFLTLQYTTSYESQQAK